VVELIVVLTCVVLSLEHPKISIPNLIRQFKWNLKNSWHSNSIAFFEKKNKI